MTPPTSNPSATSQELSEEKLREILDGCKSVAPKGPWEVFETVTGNRLGVQVHVGRRPRSAAHIPSDTSGGRQIARAKHIARLDPQTVAALITQLLSLQRKNEELVRAIDGLISAGLPFAPGNHGYDGHAEAALKKAIKAATEALRSISEEK